MGMPNAYKVADEMLKDRMRDRGMFDEFKKLERSDIIVVRGQYDHIENVFRNTGVNFGYADSSSIDYAKLDPEQIIFINCPGKISGRGIRKIKSFVHNGGFLFTTDWALKYIVEKACFLTFASPAGFQYAAVASSAIDTKALPMPSALAPTTSNPWPRA